MDKIKFSVFAYRALIGEKLRVLAEIDALYNEQNKDIFNTLIKENILEADMSKPVGVIDAPTDRHYSKEEIEHNEKVLMKFAAACQKHNLTNTTLINLDDFERLLTVTPSDIAKCIEP